MIEQETIEGLKQGIDIAELIRSKGIELTKKGKGYMGLCPFHDDHNPSLSVSPDTNLWQCFACGAGGDVIRFTQMFDNLTFPQAVKALTGPPNPELKRTPNKKETLSLTVRNQRLLERVMGYYQNTFKEDSRGETYLKKERGIIENSSLRDFGTGFVNGSLTDILPEDPEIIQNLKQMGILNRRGNEVFTNCVVFPIMDRKGAVSSLYGRRIDKKSIKHMYLPGPRAGLINRQAVKRSDILFLTESIIDALSLYDQGFKNVIPLYGVNGLTEDHLFLFNGAVKGVYLVFDADEAGNKAVKTVSERLKEKGIPSWPVTLPVKDVNDFFKTHTAEEFETLLKSANKSAGELSEVTLARKQTLFNKIDDGFVVGYGERQYQVKGIKREKTKLKVTIKASIDVLGHAPFELSTIDLYSSRSRTSFVNICRNLFDAKQDLIREDINRILILAESQESEETKEKDTEEVSPEDRKRALQFLENPDMFDEILADLETMGVTGEETNKLVSYLTAVSRKLDDPLSALVQSRSAAGKSTLQDAILSLVPEEDYVKYTRITDQALFYKDEDSLVHKILAIEEEVGMGGAAYSIRNIQSSKKITVAATGKDPGSGKMRTEEYTVKGPVSVMVTTTSAELEGETASRFMVLTIDESSDMTEAIHQKQRESETLAGLIKKKKSDHIITKHHTAQRMLKSLKVVNPYSEYLSYPAGTIRTRRDHKKYLGLIRTITYLFQYQRTIRTVKVEEKEVEYIEVTLDDIDKANRLADEVLGQCLDDLAKPSRALLEMILTMAKDLSEDTDISLDEIAFSRRMIRESSGWTDWQIRVHIKQLEELEYIHARMGSRGKEYSYALNGHDRIEENDRHYLNLTSVKSIRKKIKEKSL